jgi:hypothetical protein
MSDVMSTFENKKNSELVAFCKENQIKVNSKNPKPNKTELLDAISGFFASSDNIEAIPNNTDESITIDNIIADDMLDISISEPEMSSADDFLSEEVVKAPAPVKPKMTRAEKRRKQYKELMAVKHVIIMKNDDNQTKIKNQVHFSTWGNRLLGYHTDRFLLDTPWHVRQGALNNLKNVKVSTAIIDSEGNTVGFETKPGYVITQLDDLTVDQIKAIAKKQVIRDASIESLI